MKRNPNPYKGVEWKTQPRIEGCTHVHCTTPEAFNALLEQGLRFATLSNYYPSAPYWPIQSIKKHTFDLGQDSYIRNGEVVHERLDFKEELARWREDSSMLPESEGDNLFPTPPKGFMEAPNAEHHWFSDYNVYLHITAPGCSLTTGRTQKVPQLDSHGIRLGMPMPWRKGFAALLDTLVCPDGGGIIINHPHWSHLPHHFLCELLDFDERVLGMEIYNAGCALSYTAPAESQWDEVLGTGRQCFGFCVQDHLPSDTLRWMGHSVLLPEELTPESCLKAYRQGRFYGRILGHGLDFEYIHFDGQTLDVRCDDTAVLLLISHQGVVKEVWNSRDLHYELRNDDERREHVFFRVTASNSKTHEKLYTQPFMLI
ncbi:MAG: hypothetical protein J6X55_11120 [Victivallales bacterium]|nr:hypothetical protein [Victivallales bacterium]